MSHKVLYAYHVTEHTESDPKPKWPHLSTTTEIDRYYNGDMKDLIGKGVFFSVTLRDGHLPRDTLYPKNGEGGVKYWRALVPLSRFDDYRIIRYHSVWTQNGVEQVAMHLVPPEDFVLNTKVDMESQQSNVVTSKVRELRGASNNYLYRNEETKEWHSNNYNDVKAWVNIIVPHDVPLGNDSRWDLVRRM